MTPETDHDRAHLVDQAPAAGHPPEPAGAPAGCATPARRATLRPMAAGSTSLPDALIPQPGPRCTVCSHPAREAIDAAIVAGNTGCTELARKFALSHDAIQRHRDNHVPARLLRNATALQAKADAKFVELTIAQSAWRLQRLQKRAEQLEAIRQARGAAASSQGIPGAETGLLLTRRRSVRTGKDTYEVDTLTELDTALLAEERAIDRAAAIETGEYLAQMGRGAFGQGAGGSGPLVVVLSSGLQPLPADGAAPGDARHRIADPRRLRTATAAEVEGAGAIPLGLVDLVQETPDWVGPEVTREEGLSGVDGDASSSGPDSGLET